MHVLTGRLGKLPQKDGRVPHSVRSDLRRRLDRAVLMPRARKRKRARRSHRRPRATSGDTLSMVDAEATRMTDAPARCGRVLESGEKGCEDVGHSLNAGEPDEAVSEASGEDGHRGRDRGGSDRVVPRRRRGAREGRDALAPQLDRGNGTAAGGAFGRLVREAEARAPGAVCTGSRERRMISASSPPERRAPAIAMMRCCAISGRGRSAQRRAVDLETLVPIQPFRFESTYNPG